MSEKVSFKLLIYSDQELAKVVIKKHEVELIVSGIIIIACRVC